MKIWFTCKTTLLRFRKYCEPVDYEPIENEISLEECPCNVSVAINFSNLRHFNEK